MFDERFDRRVAATAVALLLVLSTSLGASVGAVTAQTAFAVTTEGATGVTATEATLQGNVTDLGGTDGATVYFTYWKAGQRDSTLAWWTGETKTVPGQFEATVSLDAGTTYRYRAYAKSSDGTWKSGSVREVATDGRPLAVETGDPANVSPSSATVRGDLTGLGGADSATTYVKYWPKSSDSETYWWTGNATSSPAEFAAELGLSPGTTYEYRALAKTSDGKWTAGDVRELSTPSAGFGVTTAPPSAVGVESATVGGNLTGLGGADSATTYVKYWREGHKQATSTWWTGDARSSPGSFETTFDLRAGTAYEYRAFARSADGRWKAGSVEAFTTDGEPFEVSTRLPENVTHDSATVSAELFGVGGADSATVYLRYWEEGRMDETETWWTGPTVSEPGTYETALIDLDPQETYVVQALARDDAGNWKDSRVHTFTTEGEPTDGEPPTAVYDYRFAASDDDVEPLDVGDTLVFDANDSYDPDGEIVSYEWDFDDDGETDATGAVVERSFPSGGDYPVRVTVTDDSGTSRSYEVAVNDVSERIADAVHRVNAGGSIVEEDGGPDWNPDTASSPSAYANHDASGSRVVEADSSFDVHDVGVNASAPLGAFESVREDPSAGEEMRYEFDVQDGQTYEVRVYLSEVEVDSTTYDEGGPRTFDVVVEGETWLDDFDTYGNFGHDGGDGRYTTVTAEGSTLTVAFRHEQRDPVVAAVEIVRVEEGTSES